MILRPTDDLRIEQLRPLIPPAILMEDLPLSEAGVDHGRREPRGRRRASCAGRTTGWSSSSGPCSIHDVGGRARVRPRPAGAGGRARRRRCVVVMRVYFEKPRTTVGWKGLINDPRLDGTLPDQRGAAPGARPAARPGRAWACRRAASSSTRSRRSTSPTSSLGRDRRAHHREPGPPRAGVRAVGAGRVQERHRRQHPDRDRRDPGRGAPAPFPVGDQAGAVRDRRDARQPRLPRDPARRQRRARTTTPASRDARGGGAREGRSSRRG